VTARAARGTDSALGLSIADNMSVRTAGASWAISIAADGTTFQRLPARKARPTRPKSKNGRAMNRFFSRVSGHSKKKAVPVLLR
jgi:hypothetical protein